MRVLPTQPAILQGARYKSKVIPGVIDDEADLVYPNGQCLALAVELARELDVNIRAAFSEDGDLIHAWVVDDNGDKLDIQGPQDPEGYEESLYDQHGDEVYRGLFGGGSIGLPKHYGFLVNPRFRHGCNYGSSCIS